MLSLCYRPLALTLAGCNLAIVVLCLLTGYNDMRIKYAYKTDANGGCSCAECCWKSATDLSDWSTTGSFDAWRFQVMVRVLLALAAFFVAVAERNFAFYFCTLPVVLPKRL